MAYSSETAKVKDRPEWMKYIQGRVADVGAGNDSIVPKAFCIDGRELDGNNVRDGLYLTDADGMFDTVFSSHFLEHVATPFEYILNWAIHLSTDGILFLYLPQKDAYNSHENKEHCFNWSYEDFMFFFRRNFCGEGKDYKGNHFKKYFEVVDSGLDIGVDRYSFYLIAKRNG
jgi:SAM-dependent methyltransferase